MKAKKFLAVATAVALLISMTACAGTGNEQASSADKSTSDIIDSATSSVDEHTSTESVEETSSGNDNANDESTITESSETSVADTTSSIPMKEEKIEERDVYDEDGNVVDKIKVKVVDGVTYTVGEKSDDKCILDGVPLFTNDPEFPSGDIITMVQTVLYMKGKEFTQKEIFEKYIKYHTPDEWYEEDGVNYGPKLGGNKLDRDPRTETTEYFNGFLGNAQEYIEEYCDEFSLDCKNFSLEYSSPDYMHTIKDLLTNGYLPLIQTTRESELNWSWIAEEYTGVYETQGIFSGWYCYIAIGYVNDMCMIYDLGSSKISLGEKNIIDVRAF